MRVVVLHDGNDLAEWRTHARALLADGLLPSDVQWQVGEIAGLLPADASPADDKPAVKTGTVPREFLSLADTVLAHADARRHAVLYRLLWRMTHGERHVLGIASDDDVAWCEQAAKAVRRDMHKMKAFVRFREVKQLEGSVFIAWFEPSHAILSRVAPFFVRRFAGMHWSILTPARSVHWDGQTLTFGAGAQKGDAPNEDALEALWLTYFANVFNPARLKVQAMKNEMPVRYWKNLPEAVLIPGLIRDATARMDAMVQSAPTTPKKHIPAPVERIAMSLPDGSIDALRRQAQQCRACPLWEPATQTVFGEGRDDARVMVIGEQPGDQEDLAGRPFVGPAGQLFDRALAQAGIARDALYITNTVKHFKFEPRGKRRLHARANAQEQAACRPWLLAEIERVAPKAIVCLGAMAAQAIFGRSFRLLEQRGQWIDLDDGTRAFATVHPSYLLRLPDERARHEATAHFVRDLSMLCEVMT
ncbi:UdgX family uracil-DNA binding protein [Rhodanobacter sp. L36]|uniref:UdgX family uracil-DNA binding protein n=1 Tax=Rhodanobacter sp. L36 TaxID=1747221 RepID=UPI00131D23BB|nr:UdgX family uracil-DNA binding protein [Rhodanobacter sp. L36]